LHSEGAMERARLGIGRLAGMAGAAPVLLAVLVHAAQLSQPRAIETPPRPALAFDQYLVDLGRHWQTADTAADVRATFVFRNRGLQPVQITDIRPSCGCLEPHVSSRRIEPGQRGFLLLRMQPASESPGRKEYFADVKYSDPQPREVRLTFRLEIPEQGLSVKPRALIFDQLSDREIRRQVVVADTRPQPARLNEATVNSPLVQVSLGDSTPLAGGGVEQAVHITLSGSVPPGRHEALVTIHTNDPQMPAIRVPLLIRGQPTHE
jgi:hypothetical protein